MHETPTLIALGFAFVFLILAFLMALETWMLATNRHPITDWTRLGIRNFPVVSFTVGILIAVSIGWLYAHFTCT